jgi:hypothetical protein
MFDSAVFQSSPCSTRPVQRLIPFHRHANYSSPIDPLRTSIPLELDTNTADYTHSSDSSHSIFSTLRRNQKSKAAYKKRSETYTGDCQNWPLLIGLVCVERGDDLVVYQAASDGSLYAQDYFESMKQRDDCEIAEEEGERAVDDVSSDVKDWFKSVEEISRRNFESTPYLLTPFDTSNVYPCFKCNFPLFNNQKVH